MLQTTNENLLFPKLKCDHEFSIDLKLQTHAMCSHSQANTMNNNVHHCKKTRF